MSKMTTTLVMIACLALGAAGCAEVAETDMTYEPLQATPGGPQLPLCHWIPAELRGFQATLYPLKDNPEVIAVDVDDKIVCVDGTDALLRAGITAVDPTVRPQCTICEGTPLPAEAFNNAVKRLGIHSQGI
jgi:hypothetical protein